MSKKLTVLTLVLGAGVSISAPVAAMPDVCYACMPNAASGRLECVIVPCDGDGGGSTAIVAPDTRR